MISVKCFVTDDNGDMIRSIEDLIAGDLSEVEDACMQIANLTGDFFSIKVKGGVFTIPKSRIKEVSYEIEEVEKEDDN